MYPLLHRDGVQSVLLLPVVDEREGGSWLYQVCSQRGQGQQVTDGGRGNPRHFS
jgi:hypothetical protein